MTSFRVPIESRAESVFPGPIKGRVETHRYTSRVLEGNPWGDPVERELPVYVPPSGKTEGRPLLILLSGYAGSGWVHFQRPRFHTDSIVGRLDRLIRTGIAAEAVMAAPDCVTTLGGSQYPELDRHRTVRGLRRARGRPVPQGAIPNRTVRRGRNVERWIRCAVASAAVPRPVPGGRFERRGCVLRGTCYPPDFPVAFRETRAAGGPEALLHRVLSRPISGFGPAAPLAKTLSMYAYASCYSPRDAEAGRFDLPFDLETGGLREDVWKRWLALDPVRMVTTEPYRSAARRLRYLYVDGGLRDEVRPRHRGARVRGTSPGIRGRVDLEEYRRDPRRRWAPVRRFPPTGADRAGVPGRGSVADNPLVGVTGRFHGPLGLASDDREREPGVRRMSQGDQPDHGCAGRGLAPPSKSLSVLLPGPVEAVHSARVGRFGAKTRARTAERPSTA